MNYLRFIFGNARFLGFGFALTLFSSFGQTFYVSLSNEKIQKEFNLTDGEIGALYSAATLMSGFCLIGLGRLIDHVDLRRYAGWVCAAMIVACFLMAATPSALLLVGTFFLLRLSGQGLMSHTAMTTMARYFESTRGKAMGIAGLGFPVGEAIFPLLGIWLIASYGWRQSWSIIGVGLIVVLVPMTLWLLQGHGERHQLHLEELNSNSSPGAENQSATGADASESNRRRDWTLREVLRDPRFYLLVPAIMAPGFIVTGLFFHQIHLGDVKGWDRQLIPACFIGFAATQLVISIAAGSLIDHIGASRLLRVYLVPLGLSLLVLAMSDHPAIAVAFMMLAGFTSGAGSAIVGAMWAELYGVAHHGAIRAMATAIGVFATAASPVTMGVMIDRGVSMDHIALMCAGYVLVGVVLIAFATRGAKRGFRRVG